MSVLLHVRRKISIVRFVSRCHLGVRGRDVGVFEEHVNVMLGDIAANQIIRHGRKPVGIFE
ncbi:hypothetical protein D3C71_2050970 [compost metagenome]